jgi:tetratricopeptide (TPR) repeat protein
MSRVQTPRDEAWEAMTRGEYKLAMKLYKKAPRQSGPFLNNMAYAALCLEQYEEARSTFSEVQRGYETREAPYSGRTDVAVATWLCGDRPTAIELLKTELSAIESGRTGYLDDGFGVNEGEILYYFGVASGNRSVIDRACSYLEVRHRKPLGRSWPSGLLEYLLDMSTEKEIQDIISREAVGAKDKACAVLATKAQMKFDFCRAIKAHARDGAQAARMRYSEIARRKNPILLPEWYLARSEAKQRFW